MKIGKNNKTVKNGRGCHHIRAINVQPIALSRWPLHKGILSALADCEMMQLLYLSIFLSPVGRKYYYHNNP